MTIQTIKRDGKTEFVVLPVAEYEVLIEAVQDKMDQALISEFRNQLRSGEEETVPSHVAQALISGQSPVKIWREYRGMTQDALAKKTGISKAFLSQIETKKRNGGIKTLRALAEVLKVSVDDVSL